MKFWKRLRYYLVGVGLGTLLSFFLFQGRGCGWLPGNRVLNQLTSSILMRSDSLQCVMDCHRITDTDLYTATREGEVMFAESQPNTTPKIYVIKGQRAADRSEFKLAFVLRDSLAEVDAVLSSEVCACAGLNHDNPRVVSMPDEMIRKLFLDRELSMVRKAKCQLDCYGLTDDQVRKLVQEGKALPEESFPRNLPHPLYAIVNGEYRFMVEAAEKKSRILNVSKLQEAQEEDCACEEK